MEKTEELRQRLEAKLINADWSRFVSIPSKAGIPCWLYSANLPRGPRIGGQLINEVYDDMCRGSGVFRQMDDSGNDPGDALGAVLTVFDETPKAEAYKTLGQALMLALASYARTTRTWKSLPYPSDEEGLHFVALDWVAANGRVVLRPLALICKGTPHPAKFIEGMMAQLNLHLERFPIEWPVETQQGDTPI
jgi:hypothetical protein